jgi:hypothetical protein
MAGSRAPGAGSAPGTVPSATGNGIGGAPVAIAWATTVIAPNAPTVITAAVAAVLVQSMGFARLTSPSTRGSSNSRESTSSRFRNRGGIGCEDTDPSIA